MMVHFLCLRCYVLVLSLTNRHRREIKNITITIEKLNQNEKKRSSVSSHSHSTIIIIIFFLQKVTKKSLADYSRLKGLKFVYFHSIQLPSLSPNRNLCDILLSPITRQFVAFFFVKFCDSYDFMCFLGKLFFCFLVVLLGDGSNGTKGIIDLELDS